MFRKYLDEDVVLRDAGCRHFLVRFRRSVPLQTKAMQCSLVYSNSVQFNSVQFKRAMIRATSRERESAMIEEGEVLL